MKGNAGETVALSIDFTDGTLTHDVNVEVWFSPTEGESY